MRTVRRRRVHPSDCQVFKVYLILAGTSLFFSWSLISLIIKARKDAEIKSRSLANINATDISYITEPNVNLTRNCWSESCEQGKNVSWNLVVFIKSSVSNARHREILRRTWALWGYVDGGRFATVFVIGKAQSQTANALLEEEKNRYSDILHYDGPDDYKNVAFKTLTGMKWADENLPDDYFYATGDDDFLVDLARLQETVDYHREWAVKNGTGHYPILCLFDGREGAKPFRERISKWYVTLSEYPGEVYPKFCMGGMYLTSMRVMRRLWEISKAHRPMRVDDVWITGILREKLGIPPHMVIILPEPPIATHYLGFPPKTMNESPGVMMAKEWNNTLRLAENKTLCTCK